MTDKTKKIIAREELIIIGLLVIAFSGFVFVEIKWQGNIIGTHLELLRDWILIIGMLPYVLYVSIRLLTSFIIWAVRTLREK